MEISGIVKDRNKRTKGSPDLSTLVYGKVPPQARDIEEAVLGAIMLEASAFFIAIEFLKAETFYVDAHQRIFAAMMGLQQKNMPIDILTVVEELRKRDELDVVGGPYFVTRLTNSVSSSAHLDTHCKILTQKFIQRELIRLSGEIIGMAYEDSTDAFELMDYSEKQLFQLASGNDKKGFVSTGDLCAKAIADIEYKMKNLQDVMGVPSGFRSLDNLTGGWQSTDLIILAARPSVGKTAFALNLAKNAATHPTKPIPVAVFSLEMGNTQLYNRLLSAQSNVNLDHINRGRLEEYEMGKIFNKGVKILSEAPIFIDDSSTLNIFDVRAKSRRMVAKHKVGLIIIDYLQLMSGTVSGKGGNREQEISDISRGLKAIAKELSVPIIALSQLNRAVEGRKDGVPVLSDLRESGAIEQDADMVGFLYRPDYQQESDKVNPMFRNDAFLKIAKHRNGKIETLAFKTDLSTQTWYDMPAWEEFTGESAGSWKRVSDLPVPSHPAVKNYYDKTEDFDSMEIEDRI